MKRIAVLTSGGDSQGMNTCLKAIVNTCSSHGIEVLAFNKGYQGLIENDFQILTNNAVSNIGDIGGTVIKTSRCEEFKTAKGVEKGAKNLKKNKVDAIIVLGGDGSFRGLLELKRYGVSAVGIPATIDNDMFYTDYTLGFDTALSVAVENIERIRQTGGSMDRAMVVEVMGRNCGDIALNSGFITMADSVAIGEIEKPLSRILEEVKIAIKGGNHNPIIVVSEGYKYSAKEVEKEIANKLGLDVRSVVLGYIQRGGSPSIQDKKLAISYGIQAVMALIEGRSGIAVGVEDDKIFEIPLESAIAVEQKPRLDIYDKLLKLKNLKR